MNINQELSQEDIDGKLKKIFPDKKAFLEGQLDMMKDLYTHFLTFLIGKVIRIHGKCMVK